MMNRSLTNQSALGAGYSDELSNGYDLLAAQLLLQETGGTLTTTGAEQTLYVAETPMSVFEPRVIFINLDDMVDLDDLKVRVYYRIADGGAYLLQSYTNYIGVDGGLANGLKLVAVPLLPCRYGVKVTLQQDVGNADFLWSVVEER